MERSQKTGISADPGEAAALLPGIKHEEYAANPGIGGRRMTRKPSGSGAGGRRP
ncbi:MAG: hypothetical protein LBU18_00855 [Treponema sp.]|nr:hypothetical protein [Treponema sp.]